MSTQANVGSIAAIRSFRNALANFASKGEDALYEVDMIVRRMQEWVQQDRPAFWKGELRRAWDMVTKARNDLERCRRNTVGGQRPSCYEEKKALDEAKDYVKYCEDKQKACRRWLHELEHEVSEYEGRVSHLMNVFEMDTPKALAALDRMLEALEKYVRMQNPEGSSEAASAGSGSAGGDSAASMSRGDGSEVEKDDPLALIKELRKRTPPASSRAELAVASDAELAGGDDFEKQARNLARQIGVGSAFPGMNDKVVVYRGALDVAEVYLQRLAVDDAQGAAANGNETSADSGWFIGPVHTAAELPEAYEAMRLGDVASQRPELMQVCGLPAGSLAIFTAKTIETIVDGENESMLEESAAR